MFTEDEVKAIGGPEVAALTEEPFTHICFTGGTEIGKLVMQRWLKIHLCYLELKRVLNVDSTANMKATAKRVAWGDISMQAKSA